MYLGGGEGGVTSVEGGGGVLSEERERTTERQVCVSVCIVSSHGA
jgi:hypothetical protein